MRLATLAAYELVLARTALAPIGPCNTVSLVIIACGVTTWTAMYNPRRQMSIVSAFVVTILATTKF